MATPSESETMTKKQKIVKEGKSIFVILVVVFAFRSVFFEPFRIPSGSMIPTLMIGDFILVNKFSYGFKIPFSDLSLKTLNIDWDPIFIFGKKNPQRGDVIVFKYPRDPSINYIKRVVGLPGDTLEIKNKTIHINGKAYSRKLLPGKKYMDDMDEDFKQYNFSFYSVDTGKTTHVIQENNDNIYNSDRPTLTIPKDKFFVMGDNRDISSDSRTWGFVTRKHIKGKALFVWFSLILPFGSNKVFKFRYWRIGNNIHRI